MLPEGLVIHSRKEDSDEQQVNYINKAFREIVTNHLPLGTSIESSHVYLQKTAYKFVDKFVKESSIPTEIPKKMVTSIG